MNFYAIMGGFTYFVTPEHYDITKLQSRMHDFVARHWGNDLAKEARLPLQPLSEIHYDTRYLHSEAMPTVSRETYWALNAVGLLIILIAAIDFINLSTAQAIRRAKEVGVRKVLGADRFQLVRQFLGETAVLVCLALLLGIMFTALFLSHTDDWLEFPGGCPHSLLYYAQLAGKFCLSYPYQRRHFRGSSGGFLRDCDGFHTSQTIRAASANPVKALKSE